MDTPFERALFVVTVTATAGIWVDWLLASLRYELSREDKD